MNQIIEQSVEYLNKDKILSVINPQHLSYLKELEIFATINSTNTYLLGKIRKFPYAGLVCLAEEQTAGRGRLGRQWDSPFGKNIYCSLSWQFEAGFKMQGLSLAVGVMLTRAIKKYGVRENISLKWPNDILFENRKLGGVLIEVIDNVIVIGIGLNLETLAENTNWIGLNEIHNKPVERNFLCGLILNELLEQLPIYQQKGFDHFYQAWRVLDCFYQKQVYVQNSHAEFFGISQGINEVGELLLDVDGEILKFSVGEVSLRMM